MFMMHRGQGKEPSAAAAVHAGSNQEHKQPAPHFRRSYACHNHRQCVALQTPYATDHFRWPRICTAVLAVRNSYDQNMLG